MRTTKFRGKRIDNGQWMYGFVLHCDRYTDIWSAEGKFDRREVNPETVGQFTSVFDCEGREIYEGDFLSACYGHSPNITEVTGVVEFVHCGFALRFGKDAGVWLDQLIHAEIIGNIHDNPELLKGDTE